MRQLDLSEEILRRLRQAVAAYDSIEAEQSEGTLWSVEDHADLQQICDELISVIRPYLVAASNEGI